MSLRNLAVVFITRFTLHLLVFEIFISGLYLVCLISIVVSRNLSQLSMK